MDFLWNQKSIFGIRNQFSVSEIRISDIEKWFCMFDIMHRYWFIDIKKNELLIFKHFFHIKCSPFMISENDFLILKKFVFSNM